MRQVRIASGSLVQHLVGEVQVIRIPDSAGLMQANRDEIVSIVQNATAE